MTTKCVVEKPYMINECTKKKCNVLLVYKSTLLDGEFFIWC